MTSQKKWLMVGIGLAFFAVVIGAFGAHGIEGAIPDWYGMDDLPPLETGSDQESATEVKLAQPDWFRLGELHRKKLKTWVTGVRYHLFHALAIIAVGLVSLHFEKPSRWLEWSGWLFVLGILGFSGSIYLLVLTKIKILGLVAALGGTLQLCGWACFFTAVYRSRIRELPGDE